MDNNVTEIKNESYDDSNNKIIGLMPVLLLTVIVMLRISWSLCKNFGQKTRNPQQRRLYVGSRARPSLSQQEPTIFVSPSNLPPPPKYECMAPPSYEEVVGVHYPNYQIPITQPITTALAHSSSDNPQTRNDSAPETVITVSNETRRNSVPVVRS